MSCDVGEATEGFWRLSCDVGKVTESLENEFSLLIVRPFRHSPTSQLILQHFSRFTYVTTHSQTFQLLHLRPPLWARRQHARLSRSGPEFDPRSGQVYWVRFFPTCKTNFRKLQAPKVPEYHLAIIIIITHHSLRARMT